MTLPTGFIVVIAGPGTWTVPAQALKRDRRSAICERDRGNQRAVASGREGNYQIASLSVEDGDG